MTTLVSRARATGVGLGLVILVSGPSTLLAQGSGSIRGKITEGETRLVIPAASVQVAGTRLGAQSDNNGEYVIRGVPAGQQTLRFVRIGYAPQSKVVTVVAGGEVVADIAAVRSAVQLEQVVSTATGEQKKAELGHAIAIVAADSLAKTVPVYSVSDMLTSRVPGAIVSASSGLTGQTMKIRIRGLNSFTLANDPLVILDGARIEATPGTAARLGDLNLQEIESIDVVKGPAAATLYGTDAANGVLVIRTKRGQVGKTRWEVFAETGLIKEDSTEFPNTLYGWGHNPTTGAQVQCSLTLVASGGCVQDSITSYSPLKDPMQTVIAPGHRRQLSLQASGGVGHFRYMFSGGTESELGWMRMSLAEQARLMSEQKVTSLPEEFVRPNWLGKANFRANVATDLGGKADVSVANGFMMQDFRNTSTEPFRAGYWARGQKNNGFGGYGYSAAVGDIFSVRAAQEVSRSITSLNGNYRPLDWLSSRATLGLDFSHNITDNLQRNGEGPAGAGRAGSRSESENAITQYSFDAGATANNPLPGIASLVARTSVGVQYNRRNRLTTSISGTGLPPGSETVTGAQTISGSETHQVSIVVGSFVEEQLGWRDRLFLTAAVRADGASTFGENLKTTAFPKFAASWLVSEEKFFPKFRGLESLRLRAARGESGVQPPSTASISTVSLVTGFIDNASVSAVVRGATGNPSVRPERQRETEMGADLSLFSGRLRAEVTHYDRKSTDALVQVPFATSVGGGSRYANIGSVTNKGYEGMINARVLDLGKAAFDLTLTGSTNTNQLVSVGADAPPGFFVDYSFIGARHRVGYPLYGAWQKPILSYADKNGDKIIVPDEIVVGDTEVYMGPTAPTKQITVTPELTFWRDLVRVSALFDWRGGYRRMDYTWWVGCSLHLNCPGAVDRNSSLFEQASLQAYFKNNSNIGYWSSGEMTRLREASVSIRLPQRYLRYSKAQAGNLTLAGRNLLFWSGWTGGDPEVGGGSDLEYTFPTPPLARYYIMRVNLTY